MDNDTKRWIEDHQFEITIAVLVALEIFLIVYMMSTKGGFTL